MGIKHALEKAQEKRMFESQRHTFQRGPDGRCAQCPQDEKHWVHTLPEVHVFVSHGKGDLCYVCGKSRDHGIHGGPQTENKVSYQSIGEDIGALVDSKQRQYGDSFSKSGQIMRVLYPNGIAEHQMDDALAVVRVIDKLFRIAQRGVDGKDLGGESPWRDISGYGLLGAARDERQQAERKKDG